MKVVLHCSASAFGNAALITKWHVLPKPQGRGWSAIGYHYVILNGYLDSGLRNAYFDGHLETGRALNSDNMIQSEEWGAHASGYNNYVGICLIGKSGQFTDKQKHTVAALVHRLKDQFGTVEVLQHSDLDPKKPYCAGLPHSFINLLNK